MYDRYGTYKRTISEDLQSRRRLLWSLSKWEREWMAQMVDVFIDHEPPSGFRRFDDGWVRRRNRRVLIFFLQGQTFRAIGLRVGLSYEAVRQICRKECNRIEKLTRLWWMPQ